MMQGKRPKGAFCLTDGHLSFEECRIGDETPEVQGSSCAPRRHCERRFGLLRSIYKARIISITVTAAKVMDIISRLPGCAGQAADAASACTQVEIEDAPKLLKIPTSECPDIWIRLPRHKWPKSWSNMEDPVVPPERNLYGHHLAGLLWERQFEKILMEHGWEKIPNWECSFVHRENGFFLCVWMTSNWLERNKTLIRYEK